MQKWTSLNIQKIKPSLSAYNSIMLYYIGRLDLVHILALQKLKFWHSLRHSSNMTVYNMYLFMSMADEYNMLLARYTCFTSDSAGRLRFNIDKHFADVCVVREACKWVFFIIYFFLGRLPSQSRPNNIRGGKMSVRTSVRPSVRPQKVS